MTPPSTARRLLQTLRSERGLFLLGTSLIALHVADDSFLEPPAGTSPLDHLASGLVPLLLLTAAAWAHSRVRAGWQAVIALTVGIHGIAFGLLEAGYYTSAVGPSGDDYTGLLSIPAGALLLVLGAVTLWRSRRLTDTLPRRYTRRVLLGVATALSLFLVAQPVLFAYGVTHIQRAAVPADKLDVAHQDVSFTTSDGLRLRGWYIPSRNGAAVIAFPGRLGTQAHARMLAKHGYGVLLFDRRGEGQSEGAGNLLGWGGDKDISAAVDFLQRQPDVDRRRIGGMGFSVGGELMLEAAAKDKRLAAIVSEGAGARQLSENREGIPGRDFWPMSPSFAVLAGAVAVFSDTRPPASLLDLVPQIAPRRVFLIWAPDGGNVTEALTPRYHQIAPLNSSLWAIPGAQHIKGIEAQPKAYERKVIDFFDHALPRR